MTVKTALPSAPDALKQLGVDESGKVQRLATDEIFNRLIDYIPYKSGSLRATASVKSANRIRVDGKYARVQFFGVTKSGRPFNYDRTRAPKAGSHWDRRLVAAEGEKIVKSINRQIKRKES